MYLLILWIKGELHPHHRKKNFYSLHCTCNHAIHLSFHWEIVDNSEILQMILRSQDHFWKMLSKHRKQNCIHFPCLLVAAEDAEVEIIKSE